MGEGVVQLHHAKKNKHWVCREASNPHPLTYFNAFIVVRFQYLMITAFLRETFFWCTRVLIVTLCGHLSHRDVALLNPYKLP